MPGAASTLGSIDPTNVADLKAAFARLRKPRNYKQYAQNFLVSQLARDAIVAAADVRGEQVLEIGPGSGVLTQQLVKAAARVVALDIDPYLLEVTWAVCGNAKNLELRLEDVRQVNLPALFPDCRYVAVSNVPYYLTGYLLELLTSAECSPHRIVLTVQREVADRLLAQPGDHTLLSISVALFGTTTLVDTISRRAFWPAPNVDSAAVRITRHVQPVVPVGEQRWLMRVVKAGFSARRKKLVNSLAGGLQLDVSVAQEAVTAVGLAATVRAQELSVDQWAQLSRKIEAPDASRR